MSNEELKAFLAKATRAKTSKARNGKLYTMFMRGIPKSDRLQVLRALKTMGVDPEWVRDFSFARHDTIALVVHEDIYNKVRMSLINNGLIELRNFNPISARDPKNETLVKFVRDQFTLRISSALSRAKDWVSMICVNTTRTN